MSLPSRTKGALWFLVGVVAVQGVLVLGYRWLEKNRDAEAEPPFRIERLSGELASDLAMLDAAGVRHTLAEHRGRPVLLHFWATWCPPCKDELPQLLATGRTLAREDGWAVVAVAMDENWDAVNQFFAGEIPPEVTRNADETATRAYDLSSLPDTYIVDASGALRARIGGARDWTSTRVRDVITITIKEH